MSPLTIAEYMTSPPHTIGPKQPLAAAHALMRTYKVRHLPVLQDGCLVGLVSMGDLHLLETLPDVEPFLVTVEEAMTRTPYVVKPTTPLAEVAHEMAERKLGSAVVQDGAEVVGVFTAVDGMRALADLAASALGAPNSIACARLSWRSKGATGFLGP